MWTVGGNYFLNRGSEGNFTTLRRRSPRSEGPLSPGHNLQSTSSPSSQRRATRHAIAAS